MMSWARYLLFQCEERALFTKDKEEELQAALSGM